MFATDPFVLNYILKKLNNMNFTKITSQEDAISAVRGQLYFIGSVDASGNYSMSSNPAVHYTLTEARKEAKRLASTNVGRLYFISKFCGGEYVPTSQTISI